MSSGVRLAVAATATAAAMANGAHQRLGSSLGPAMASSQAGTRAVGGGAGQIPAQKRQRAPAGGAQKKLEAPLAPSRRAIPQASSLAAPAAVPGEAAQSSGLASSRQQQAVSHVAAGAAPTSTWLTGSSRAAELQQPGGAALWRHADVAAEAERRTAGGADASSNADRAVVSDLVYHVSLARGAAERDAEGVGRVTGLSPDNILKLKPKASFLRPAFYTALDHERRLLIVAFRGTSSSQDLLTSLSARPARIRTRPHRGEPRRTSTLEQLEASSEQELFEGGEEEEDRGAEGDGRSAGEGGAEEGAKVGAHYGHFGALQAAEWFLETEVPALKEVLAQHPGYGVRLVGHSLGAAVASLLAVRLRREGEAALGVPGERVRCVGVSTPPCMSHAVSEEAAPYITTLVLQDDVVPRLSVLSVRALVQEMLLPWRRARGNRETEAVGDFATGELLCTPGRVFHIVRRPAARPEGTPQGPASPAQRQAPMSLRQSEALLRGVRPSLEPLPVGMVPSGTRAPHASVWSTSALLAPGPEPWPSSAAVGPAQVHQHGLHQHGRHPHGMPQHSLQQQGHKVLARQRSDGARSRMAFQCYACQEGRLLQTAAEGGAPPSAEGRGGDTRTPPGARKGHKRVVSPATGRREVAVPKSSRRLTLGQLRSIFLIILRALNPSIPIAFLQSILLGLVSAGALLAPLRKRGPRARGASPSVQGRRTSRSAPEGTVQRSQESTVQYALVESMKCDSFHRIVFSPTMLKDHRTYNILHALGQIQEQHQPILVA